MGESRAFLAVILKSISPKVVSCEQDGLSQNSPALLRTVYFQVSDDFIGDVVDIEFRNKVQSSALHETEKRQP